MSEAQPGCPSKSYIWVDVGWALALASCANSALWPHMQSDTVVGCSCDADAADDSGAAVAKPKSM